MKFLAILLSALPFLSQAQGNHPGIRHFEGGIIMDGDSILGKVGYHRRKNLVIFKTSSSFQYLNPTKIEGFYFENGASFMSGRSQNISDSTISFFQQLVLGDSVSLVYDIESKAYFLKKHKRLTQIDSKKSGKKLNNNLELLESKGYIIALLKEMSNCDAITPVIHETKVNQRDLSSLVSLYNECLGAQHKIIPQIQPKSNTHFGIKVSYELSRFKVKSVYPENSYSSKTYLTSASPSVGLYYYKEIGKTFRKAAFISEINFINENFETYNEITLPQDSMEFNQVNLKSSNIRIPLQFRIPLISIKNKLNISSLLELLPIFRFNSTFSRTREVGYTNTFYTSIQDSFDVKNFDFAQSIGFGIELLNNKNRDIFFDTQIGKKDIPLRPNNDSGAKNANTYISFGLRFSL